MGRFTRQHVFNSGVIIGEGITDKFKSLIKRKKKTQKAPPKPQSSSNTKKAGEQIIKMLGTKPKTKPKPIPKPRTTNKKLTQQEINNRVLQIMSGGGKIM